MARQRVYSVHVAKRDPQPFVDAAVFVREGFCWPAFLFTVLWALWHRMWSVAFRMLVLSALAGGALELAGADDGTAFAVMAALAAWFGLEGNDWRRRWLERQGYSETALVAGPDLASAERAWVRTLPEPLAAS